MTGWQLIAIWDANRMGGPGTAAHGKLWDEIRAWALAHGADGDTHRYEIWMLDCPIARVLRYKRNDHGFRFIDYGDGEAAQQPAKVVILDELPPQRLRVSADTPGSVKRSPLPRPVRPRA